ncbi:MAG: alpha/beta hydrolase [Firmicutes bacterium]|nr:alpha/beta hydrolase [Bacillota bacterium]
MMLWVQKGLAGAALLMLAHLACGGSTAAPSEPPSDMPKGMYASAQFTTDQLTVRKDIEYSQRANPKHINYTSEATKAQEINADVLHLTLDLYRPPTATAQNRQPLMVVIHGGGFVSGSKGGIGGTAASYALAGYVSATINYRLTENNQASQELRVAAQAMATEDAQNAIRFLLSRASEYGIDPTRVAVFGSSAGGAISLINAVDANDNRIRGVSDYPGFEAKPHAALSTGATLIDSFDSTGLLHFDAGDAPVLLLHAYPQDPATGATWTGNVLPTQKLINDSGSTCLAVPTPAGIHTVEMAVGADYWPQVYAFLKTRLRLP